MTYLVLNSINLNKYENKPRTNPAPLHKKEGREYTCPSSYSKPVQYRHLNLARSESTALSHFKGAKSSRSALIIDLQSEKEILDEGLNLDDSMQQSKVNESSRLLNIKKHKASLTKKASPNKLSCQQLIPDDYVERIKTSVSIHKSSLAM